MPRKIILENETDPVKPKREITDAQREHLNKIRLLAMVKKAELKEITLKSKLAKTVPKQELAKQYDNYVAQKAVHNLAVTNKPAAAPRPVPRPEPEPESESEPTTTTTTYPAASIHVSVARKLWRVQCARRRAAESVCAAPAR